jgi:hydrogenase maturation protease
MQGKAVGRLESKVPRSDRGWSPPNTQPRSASCPGVVFCRPMVRRAPRTETVCGLSTQSEPRRVCPSAIEAGIPFYSNAYVGWHRRKRDPDNAGSPLQEVSMVGASSFGGRGRRRQPLLLGGFGVPWQRDVDFGSRFVCCVEDLEWPEDVVVGDLSYSALHVLHRLQELGPAKVVVVTAAVGEEDRPGTLRRYPLDVEPPPPEEVHQNLGEAVGGDIDLEQMLAVTHYWCALPPGSVMIEVEPADTSLGLGMSDEMAACIDSVLAAVREEIGGGLAPAATVSERIYAQLLTP